MTPIGGVPHGYYARSLFAADGEGAGEYGPINHMFPITPVALHEGWIDARERIVTTQSGRYTWKCDRQPRIYLFDPVGRKKHHDFRPRREADAWSMDVELDDWRDIAIIVK